MFTIKYRFFFHSKDNIQRKSTGEVISLLLTSENTPLIWRAASQKCMLDGASL